ncbi:hypothetical protein KPH14_007877 [Odynerus spinipes]|uniref:Uncharacterized protein n=1 Tax=Odynerus spinipes TaxID=1348599 RepID=A0AAD9S0J1_9HYME|nr:hypothetical protein KPH14_007877 [Odynerus spinipes]
MSRCVTLLMQVLKETNDSRMLMQLCVQLAKIPDSDKKYLHDSEREQLSRQALTLCLQSLKSRVHTMGSPSTIDSVHLIRTDSRTQVLLDVYKIYQQVQKHFQNKEPTIQAFASLLTDTYKTYIGNKNLDGNILEMAIKCCQRQILANKIAATNNVGSTNLQISTTSSSPATTSNTQVTSTSPQSSQNRKPYRNLTSTGRPRGRPPNVNKYLQAMQQGGNIMNQFNSKNTFANYIGTPGNRALMNPYFMNPLIDPSMLSAMLASSLGGNMMDPLSAMSYLNQVGSYQDILRQYQTNLSSLSNLTGNLNNSTATVPSVSGIQTMSTSSSNTNTNTPSSISNLSNISTLTVQQLLNLSNSSVQNTRSTPTYHQATTKTTTTTSVTKDRPNISITPVSTSVPQKSKPARPSPQTDALPVHIPKSLQISQASKTIPHPPTTQVSLLKPSIIQQVKTSPPKQMTAPQIRVSKSLTEPQPAHNSSLSHAPLKTSSPSNSSTVPQVAHTSMNQSLNLKSSLPMNLPTSRSGTSLQHKLLSKKNSQRTYHHAYAQNSLRKQKVVKNVPIISNSFPNMVNTMSVSSSLGQTPYIPTELSGISVSPVSQSGVKGSNVKVGNYKRPSTKPKSVVMDVPSPLSHSFPQTTSAEALSMLSQLQQHSHLEIIPQQKNQMKTNVDFSKNLSSSVSVQQKTSETLRQPNSECMTLYDLPRGKPSKKADKSANDNVEIITLDD